MLLDFKSMEELVVPAMNGGDGQVRANMLVEGWGKVIYSVLEPGCSIGSHEQATSVDINYVVSGRGIAVCDGVEEALMPGTCRICPRGSVHSIENTSDEDLVLFSVVAERS